MTKKTRLVTASISIVAFLILAPVLVLYSMGYRFNKETKAVGMLYLRSTPKNASVYVNGKQVEEKTPTAITELKEGGYQVKIEKEGFSSWEKKLSVIPNIITEAGNIYLLPLSLNPKLVTEHTITHYKLSPSQEKIAYISDNAEQRGIWVLNLKDLSKTQAFSKLIHRELEVPDEIEWSGDSKKILFSAEPEARVIRSAPPKYFIIDIEKPTEILDISEYALQKEIKDPRWHPTDSNRIYYSVENKNGIVLGIFELNLINKESRQVLSGEISSYAFTNNEIYSVKKITTEKQVKMEFWKSNLDGSNPYPILENLPVEPDYRILLSRDKNVLLFTLLGRKLYLLNPLSDQLETLENEVTEAQWSPNGKYILYLKDNHEIWIFNFKNKKIVFLRPGEKMLIGKYASEIQEVAWFSTSEHIIFKTNDEIKIIEVDGRSGANLNKITKTESSLKFNVGKDGEIFYFANKVEGTEKLYEILLTEKELIPDIIR